MAGSLPTRSATTVGTELHTPPKKIGEAARAAGEPLEAIGALTSRAGGRGAEIDSCVLCRAG